MRQARTRATAGNGLLLAVGGGLLLALALAGLAAGGGVSHQSARIASAAPSSIAARATAQPTVRPAWNRKQLTVRAGATFAVTLDPTTAKACGVAVIGPFEGQEVSWNFKTSGLLLKLKLRTNVDATPGRWTLRASCGQANGKPPLVAKMILVVRGAANGHGLVAEHRALRVRQVPLVSGKDSGKVRARGAGGNPFSSVECVSWAWEKRADIYNRAVAAGVLAGGYRPHPTFQYDYLWNAKYWAENAARAGIPEGPTPVVGAIGVYTQGTYGHVVYVERVNGDGSFNFSQRNGTGCECTSAVTTGTDTARAGLVFIYGGPAGNGPGPPPFDPNAYVGHIVKQDNGNVTAWLVIQTPNGPRRNWIPDQATFNCLRTAGHPFSTPGDLLNPTQLDKIPDQTGVHAACSTPTPPPPPPPPPPPTGDTTPPSVPSGLSISNVTTSSLRVNWAASSDNVGVTGYDVFLDGSLAGTVSVLYGDIIGQACGSTHTLGVDARDAAGNVSAIATIQGGIAGCPAPSTWAESTGSPGSGTFTNYTNAGGTLGPRVGAYTTVQISCRLTGWTAPDGNNWWYRINSGPWSDQYFAPADNFYNNGATSGSLSGTPFYDPAVRLC